MQRENTETEYNVEQGPRASNKEEANTQKDNVTEQEGNSVVSGPNEEEKNQSEDCKEKETDVEDKKENSWMDGKRKKGSDDESDKKSLQCLFEVDYNFTVIKVVEGNIAEEEVDAIGKSLV